MTLYILTGYTDSGDDVGPYVWDHSPTDNEVNVVFARDWPEDFEADTIEYWDISSRELENLT